MKNRYNEYFRDIHKAGTQIELKKVVKSPSKGLGKFRDDLTFFKSAWQAAASWISFPKEFVYWTSLTPLSLASVNELLKKMNFPLVIPLDWGSIIAVGTIIGMMIFGVLSWSKMGLTRRGSEINALHNSSQYLLYQQHESLREQNTEITDLLKSINKKL